MTIGAQKRENFHLRYPFWDVGVFLVAVLFVLLSFSWRLFARISISFSWNRFLFRRPSLQAVRAETMVDGLPRACRLVLRWASVFRRQFRPSLQAVCAETMGAVLTRAFRSIISSRFHVSRCSGSEPTTGCFASDRCVRRSGRTIEKQFF